MRDARTNQNILEVDRKDAVLIGLIENNGSAGKGLKLFAEPPFRWPAGREVLINRVKWIRQLKVSSEFCSSGKLGKDGLESFVELE